MAKEFNYPIHAFRGFAILNIVAIHAFAMVLIHAEATDSKAGLALGVIGALNGVLLHDATLYFTYISGILFSMILAKRGFKRFFRSKFLYVFLPYLFFTTINSLRSISGPPEWQATLFDGTVLEFLQVISFNLVMGSAIRIFWYIPVLLVLYMLTPLIARLVSAPGWIWLKALIIAAPLVASRVWPEVSWTNYVYFLGAYMIGIIVGNNYQATIRLIRANMSLLVVVALLTSLAIAATGFFQLPAYGIINLAESAWYIQKIAIAGLVLLWFDNTMTAVPKWLDLLGNYAFAVFFIHMTLVLELVQWLAANDVRIDTTASLVMWLGISFTLALGGSVLITYVGKLLLGRYSRYFLGA